LEAAWAQLTTADRARTSKLALAKNIVDVALRGERDAARLVEAALNGTAGKQHAAPVTTTWEAGHAR
jgi:hypothetical protein